MRVLTVLLLAIVVHLQYQLWGGEGSLSAVWALEQSIDAQKLENTALLDRNQRLAAEVIDLGSGLETVEATARRDLGMVSRNETFFHLVQH